MENVNNSTENPPAAATVASGAKTEQNSNLQAQLLEIQRRNAELEKQVQDLKNPPTPAQVQKKSWLDDCTIID